MSVPAANPTQTDSNGMFTVYAGALEAPNLYVVNAVPQQGTITTWVVPGPTCPLSGCNLSGPLQATSYNATSSPYYKINGVQIASANLSDGASLAKLSSSNTFTGTTQTAPIFNATGGFMVNGVQISASNLLNGTTGTGLIVLNASPTLTTPNIGAATGTSLSLSGSVTAGGGAAFGGSLAASAVNSTSGYQIGGSAPSGHFLMGNGTYYADSSAFPASSISGLYYQSVQANGSPVAQSTALNFGSTFSVSAGTYTTVNIATTGTAGTYTSIGSITTDAYGRVTSITPVSSTPRTCSGNSCYEISSSGTIVETILTGTLNTNSPTTIYLPHSIPTAIMSIICSDASYRVQSGNVQAVGGNVSGLSAPFGLFYVSTEGSNVVAYCEIRGY